MTYGNTWFNDTEVMTMTKNQFIKIGSRGNKLTEVQLGEVYDLIEKKHSNANDSKHVTSGPNTERINISSGRPEASKQQLPVESKRANVNGDSVKGSTDWEVQE